MNYISSIVHVMRTAFVAEEAILYEDSINHAAQNAHQKSKQAMCSILNQDVPGPNRIDRCLKIDPRQ